jgi:hypothetical protein
MVSRREVTRNGTAHVRVDLGLGRAGLTLGASVLPCG